jgi:hypothetical protein
MTTPRRVQPARFDLVCLRAYAANPPPPNDPVPQRGRLEGLRPSECRQAGPVCCKGQFGGAATTLSLQDEERVRLPAAPVMAAR